MHMLVHQMDQPGPVHSEIRALGSDAVYASMVDASVGSDPELWMDACRGSKRVVVRCGDPVEVDSPDADAARVLASWSVAGWGAFDEHLARLDQVAQEAGIELMIRPSSDGMLSDAICTMAWARRAQGLGCTLLLDPVGWLVGSMMRDVDDHLRRISELCFGCTKVGAVLVRSVRTNESGKLTQVSLRDGEIDPGLIVDRLCGLVRSVDALVVLDSADLDLFGL